MAIFRGIGGAGDSTTDATVQAVTEQAVNAANSATAAASSASAASSSSSAASSSATNAASSATAAASSETNAAASAAAASSSQTAAASSASSASTSASNAASSASSASTSSTNAANSASAASTSASNAATSASNAATSETNAASSASAASTSASNAATSETNAANSASAASTSASNAATSESNAAASEAAAAASYDSFDDRYLGAKSSDPSLDNDGNALLTGALYFNTADNLMKMYSGSTWLTAYATLSGALLATNNLADLTNTTQATTNLGLGTGNSPSFAGLTLSGGTANGVLYLNGSKVATSGSALTFDGTTFATTGNVTLGDASTDTVQVNGYMGVRATPVPFYGIALGNASTITGDANPRGISSSAVYGSDATGLAAALFGQVRTTATAYTMANAAGLRLGDVSKGAGSTVTNQHGVYLEDQTQGTNNFGITSLVSSGANKWNIYASGTANNYFAGSVGIGTSSPTAVLASGRVLEVSSGDSSEVIVGKTSTNIAAGADIGGFAFKNVDSSLGTAPHYAGIRSKSEDTSGNMDLRFYTGVSNYENDTPQMRIDSSGNVGIGNTSASSFNAAGLPLVVGSGSGNTGLTIYSGTAASGSIHFADGTTTTDSYRGIVSYSHTSNYMTFWTDAAERMRIDSSGNLLVARTAPNTYNTAVGFEAQANGLVANTRDGAIALILNRLTSDGDIAVFRKDGTTVGSIGTNANGNFQIYNNQTSHVGIQFGSPSILPVNNSGASADNAVDLGDGSVRFKDLYLSGGVYVGGTGAANLLDDYEEGTFTPTIIGTTVAGTGTYTNQVSKYTKVGNQVTFQIYIGWTAHTGTGNMRISGLPFTSTTTTNAYSAATFGEVNNIALSANNIMGGYVAPNSTQIVPVQNVVGGGAVSSVPMDSSGSIIVSGSYVV